MIDNNQDTEVQNNEVAKIIMDQIETGFNLNFNINGHDNKISFFKFYGASEMFYDADSFRFKVAAPNFKGKILITLNSNDYYNVEFWKIVQVTNKFMFRGKELKSKHPEPKLIKEFKDIDAENLTPLLKRELGGL